MSNQTVLEMVQGLLKNCKRTESIKDYESIKRELSVLCGELCMNKENVNFNLYGWAVKKAIKIIGI
jgi:hypothetical protein